MRFLFCENAGELNVILEGDAFLHIKARRVRVGETIAMRNLRDDRLYFYSIVELKKTHATATLEGDEVKIVLCDRAIDLAWCVVDPKTIEKTLPFLNEIGARKLYLLWSEKSQRGFHLSLNRFNRILNASCEQCGRSRKMEVEIMELAEFVTQNSNIASLDFNAPPIEPSAALDKILIVGPEGGFGAKDYETLKNYPRYSLSTPLVLRSETAIVLIAARALTF
ncbi:MAG: 16S rRNA (uracil(1498)-N(3))-methyltransferase [Helicobacteraceae bacterium]|jgi:16S rRNA (uracil1498-N3)-methyltransferase|nr:16S rRNA (uracil(1498)-N(3))-methyltransferase [Helicobacteraceae bacterium]